MTFNKWLLLLVISFFLIISNGIVDAKSILNIEAGLVETGQDYVKASEGFKGEMAGVHLWGDHLYMDLLRDDYTLTETALTLCDYEEPHFHIKGQVIKLYPEYKIVIKRPKIYIGKVPIPLLWKMVMKYHDNGYRLTWKPTLILSSGKGLGLRMTGYHSPLPGLETETSFEATNKGNRAVGLKTNYQYKDKIKLSGDFEYGKDKTQEESPVAGENKVIGSVNLPYGFLLSGEAEYKYFEEKEDEKEGNLGLYWRKGNKGLYAGHILNWQKEDELRFGIKTGNIELLGIKSSLTTEGSFKSEKLLNYSFIDIEVKTPIKAKYNLGKMRLGLSYKPIHTWSGDENIDGTGLSKIWLERNFGDIYTKLGYGQKNKWVWYNSQFDDWERVDRYVEGKLNYNYKNSIKEKWQLRLSGKYNIDDPEKTNGIISYRYRNQKDEGWDLGLKVEYDTEEEELKNKEIIITRALDCVDLSAEVDIIERKFEMGIDLKY